MRNLDFILSLADEKSLRSLKQGIIWKYLHFKRSFGGYEEDELRIPG